MRTNYESVIGCASRKARSRGGHLQRFLKHRGFNLCSRKPLGSGVDNEFEYPVQAEYKKSDVTIPCDSVFVPWEEY